MSVKAKMLLLELIILIVICSFNYRLLFGLLAIMLHEFTHILFSRYFGIKMFNFQICFTGVRGEVQGIEDLSYKQKVAIYISGPSINLILALLMFLTSKYVNSNLLIENIWINICLGIFNLLPAYPLDGARICENILSQKKIYKETKNILVKLSFIISGLLIILFIVTIFIHKANLSLLLTATLILYSAIIEKKNTMYILMANLFKKRRLLLKKEYIENKNICVYFGCTLGKALTFVDSNKYISFFVLNDSLELIAVIYEDELIEALKTYGNISFSEYLEKSYKT
jgi:stage IV sporulation protein FB